MAEKLERTSSRFVRYSDLAARLRSEFPQSQINVAPVQGGECTLTVEGADVHTVYWRAQMLACISVLFNSEAFFNRQLNKAHWTRFASLCGQCKGRSRTELCFRRGSETSNFLLEPVGQSSNLTLYLREL